MARFPLAFGGPAGGGGEGSRCRCARTMSARYVEITNTRTTLGPDGITSFFTVGA